MLVQPGPSLLELLRNYKSASTEVRTAIASPTQENEDTAWEAVMPIVSMLQEFYGYSCDLGKWNWLQIYTCTHHSIIGQAVPELLQVLCQGDVAKNLENHQGLTKLFADMLDFVFEFDYLKVSVII